MGKPQKTNTLKVTDTRTLLVWFTNNTAVEALPDFRVKGDKFIFDLVDDLGKFSGTTYSARISEVKMFEPIP